MSVNSTPKVLTGVYLSDAARDVLKKHSTRCGVSMSELADLFIQAVSRVLTDSQIDAWAQRRRVVALKPNERRVVDTLLHMQKRDVGAFKFLSHDIVTEAGLSQRVGYGVLCELERKGVLASRKLKEDTDRFGRPTDQYFWHVESWEAHMAAKAVSSAVVEG